MPEDAVMDLPEIDLDTDDTGTDDGETGGEDSGETGSESSEQSTETSEETGPVIADVNGNLKLSEKARTELDQIKQRDPKLAREIRAGLFDRQVLAQKGLTVKDALATIEAYEAEGGSEAVQAIKGELDAWKGLDADFQAGKPEFVRDIAAGNPDAFIKAAPHVMAKFAEMDNPSFSHEVGKVFAADMAANNVVLTMERMRDFIFAEDGKTVKQGMEGIARQWNALAGYVDRVNGMATNAPKPKEGQHSKPGAETSDIDQREQALTIREFGSERARILDSVTSAEFKRNIGNRKASETQIGAIQELYQNRLDKVLRSDKKHTDAVDRFLAAKDKAGYAKHIQAAYKAKAPLAMDQAFKAILPGKPGPAAKTAAKGAAVKTATTDTTGWTRVSAKPATNQIAHWKMTAKMLKEGKYILRDGKQVIYSGR
jgi:hypothetical protein